MLNAIWHDFLYQPLFNLLIWLYNNWTDHNLGWAIVYLTLMLRTVLLPFTIIDHFNRSKDASLREELQRIQKGYANDEVLKNEEIRRVLRERRVKPWAKAVVLGIQALVLVLLYQVFLRGITGEKILKILYANVDFPGIINTYFYGLNLAERNTILLPLIVSLWLVVEIYSSLRARRASANKSDLFYFIAFPLAVFFILWWLPTVKALFILTSMMISLFISLIFKLFSGKKEVKTAETSGAGQSKK